MSTIRKVISFQQRLFLIYSFFVSVVICAIFGSFFFYFQSHLKQNSEMLFAQTSRQILLNLDSSIRAMDTTATQIVVSKTVQDGLIASNAGDEGEGNYFDYQLAVKSEISSFLSSVNSTKDMTRRISVVDYQYNFVSFGTDLLIANKAGLQKQGMIFPEVSTSFVLKPPHQSQWSSSMKSDKVISLVRQIRGLDSGFEPLGIVEVIQDYSVFEQIFSISPEMQVVVLDSENNVIYPANELMPAEADLFDRQLQGKELGKMMTLSDTEGIQLAANYVQSEYTGFRVMLMQPEVEFLKPVYLLRNYLLVFMAVLVAVTLLFTHAITKSVTSPIRKLKNAIVNGTFENERFHLDLEPDSSTVLNEIELLRKAFTKMIDGINRTNLEIIQARSSEARAHFLALQAQMNPHFLFNSLMCISAAGQEAGSEKIKMMCAHLSELLRYVSSLDNTRIRWADEVNHAQLYLQFMKWRYEDRFEFTLQMDERLMEVNIPKLILQPLLENSFEHGFMRVRAPWHVSVAGIYWSENQWEVRVQDNGAGFTDEELTQLESKMDLLSMEMENGELSNRLEIGGMGLLNIWFRLKLLYKEKALFKVEQMKDGGTMVVIGIRPAGGTL